MTATLRILAIALVSLLSVPRSTAQQSQEEAAEMYQRACQRTIDFTLTKLRPHLAEHQNLQGKNDLVLLVPAADFNAFSDYTTERVLIPLAWCVQTLFFIDATLQAAQNRSLKPKYIAYVDYLNSRQRAAVKKGGFDSAPVVAFETHGNFRRSPLPADEEQRHHQMREDALIDSMAFVIGHEIGHLALKHKPATKITPAASRRQEYEADIFSAALAKKAGFTVFLAVTALQRYISSEAQLKSIPSGDRTHPRAECRMERLWAISEMNDLLKQPARRRDFERGSGYSVAEFRDLLARLREDCRQNP
jgi:hypothetical protein